jgi:iron complex transport system ATP-binding protein
MKLAVQDLYYNYKTRQVLQNISFTVTEKEIIGILGPNGVGKTTLLKCINRILKPYRGTVLLNNENILHFSQNQIAQKISYVPQKAETGKMTVFDTILLGRKPHLAFNVSDRDLKLVQGIIKTLNLESIALRYTEEISGGELQKVAIARALVQEPQVMLLDEPTASLDLKNQLEILNLIRDISKFHNVATIMTVHDINIAMRYADRIVFLKAGTILAEKSPDEVTAEIIEDVYGVKVNIREFDNYQHIFPL